MIMDGVPPMILQSLHGGLPLPAVQKPDRNAEIAEAADEQPAEFQDRSKEKRSTPNKRKKRPANRRKIRELIARKYKNKNTKSEQRQNWIAKLFAWPEAFKADSAGDNRVVYADEDPDDDLEPKPASNLKREFRAQVDDESAVQDVLPVARKKLLAYNGDPADTLDVMRSSQNGKRIIDDSDTVDKPFGWGVDSSPTNRPKRTETKPGGLDRTGSSIAPVHAVQIQTEPSSSSDAISKRSQDAGHVLHPHSSNGDASKSERNAKAARRAALTEQNKSSGNAVTAQSDDDGGAPFYLKAHKMDTHTIASKPPATQQTAVKLPPLTKRNPAMVEDEWTKRLRYLAENGTSSLKHGEAFMFSEDTGEAVLFLASGQRIRRLITAPVDSQEVIKMRRPDVLIPKELFFNTSLLGKVVKDPPAPPPVPANPIPPPRGINSEMDEEMEQLLKSRPSSIDSKSTSPPNFKIEQIMDNPTGFWNWSKRLLNL
jgi:hypothetical protein